MTFRDMVDVLRATPKRELAADMIVLVALVAALYALTVVAVPVFGR